MAGLQIEGDLSHISEIQLESIKSVIENRGYRNNKVEVEAVCKAGDNYVAVLKRIIIHEDDGNSFRMIAKVAPQFEVQRLTANTELLFRNEHLMYTKVLPRFTQLEISADVPAQNRLRYAACYGSLTHAPHEVILLEDLLAADFKMMDRMKPLSDQCIRNVLKNFALLHSLSYAIKKEDPGFYDEVKDSMFDMWPTLHLQNEVIDYFHGVEENFAKMLENQDYKKLIRGAVSRNLLNFAKLSKSDKDSKYSVIQQGDAWTNNLMFKFEGDVLLETVMIDYQLSKSSSPVCDILYMIFNCTNYEMRKEHFYDWLDYYHSELGNALSQYGLKVNYVYSRDQLDADLKRYGRMSFGVAILAANLQSLNDEEAQLLKDNMATDIELVIKDIEQVSSSSTTTDVIKQRVEGLLKSYIEFGLL